jgi:hypothetical protein
MILIRYLSEVCLGVAYFLMTLWLSLPSLFASRLPTEDLQTFYLVTFLPWCVRPLFGFVDSKRLLQMTLPILMATVITELSFFDLVTWRVFTLGVISQIALAATETALDNLSIRNTKSPQHFQALRLISKALSTTVAVIVSTNFSPAGLITFCVCPAVTLILVHFVSENRDLISDRESLNFRQVFGKFWPLFLFLVLVHVAPPKHENVPAVLDLMISLAVPVIVLLPMSKNSATIVSAVYCILNLALCLWSRATLAAVASRLGQVVIALVGIKVVEYNNRELAGFWFSLVTVTASWAGFVSGLVFSQRRYTESQVMATTSAALCVLAFQLRLDRIKPVPSTLALY